MAGLNRENVERVLGPIEDDLLADIMRTGASAEELAQAHIWVVNDQAMVDADHRPPSGRLAALVKILDSIEGPAVLDE